jgi:hypothetical protein
MAKTRQLLFPLRERPESEVSLSTEVQQELVVLLAKMLVEVLDDEGERREEDDESQQ